MIQADWAKIGVKTNIVTFGGRASPSPCPASRPSPKWAARRDYPDPSELMAWQTCNSIEPGERRPWCNDQIDDAITRPTS